MRTIQIVAASIAVSACSDASQAPQARRKASPIAAPGSRARSAPVRETQDAGNGSDLAASEIASSPSVAGATKRTVAGEMRYMVALSSPDELPKGSVGVATIELVPQDGWTLGEEVELSVTAPADVKLAKEETLAGRPWRTFTVHFKSTSPGAKVISAELRFEICEDRCEPKVERFAWRVVAE